MLKADVSGSLEAFEDEIAKLPQDEVTGQVDPAAGVGGITESDVKLAAASDAIILGFNVRPVGDARQLADREGVEIRTYSVIYRAIDELRDAMQGMLAPEEVEDAVGHARDPRRSSAPRRSASSPAAWSPTATSRAAPRCRLVRDGTVVYDGEIDSLRRFNDDVREVPTGFECGIVLENFADVKEGDAIEVYETRQVERTLSLVGGALPTSSFCSVHLYFPEAGSLKAQASRAEPREGAPAASACGASVAEVDHQDTWQRSTLAVALAGGSPALCEGAADDVQR